MKIYAEKDGYKCVLLEPDEIQLYFDACYLARSEEEGHTPEENAKALANLAAAGPAYFSDIFNHEGFYAFILLDSQNQIIGGGDIHCDMETGIAECGGLHVKRDHRGKHLADLIYNAWDFQARHFKAQKERVIVDFNNSASLTVADRNGFKPTQKCERFSYYVLERDLV